MKYNLLMLIIMLVTISCTHQYPHPQRYDIFTYDGAYGDIDYEMVDYHYWNMEEPKEGVYGTIQLGNEDDFIPVDVYKEGRDYYCWEWNPTTGSESKRWIPNKFHHCIIQRDYSLKSTCRKYSAYNHIVRFIYIDEAHIQAKAQRAIWLAAGYPGDTILLNPRESVLLKVPDDEFNISIGTGDDDVITYTF